jgi:hypothetical protein
MAEPRSKPKKNEPLRQNKWVENNTPEWYTLRAVSLRLFSVISKEIHKNNPEPRCFFVINNEKVIADIYGGQTIMSFLEFANKYYLLWKQIMLLCKKEDYRLKTNYHYDLGESYICFMEKI